MIIHKYRAIFLHIPKCAGTSMEEWIRREAIPGEKAEDLRQRHLPHHMNIYPYYFLFTFIRNPYDRFVSVFQHGTRHYQFHANRHFLVVKFFRKWWNLRNKPYSYYRRFIEALPNYRRTYYDRTVGSKISIYRYAELIRAKDWDQLSQFDRYHLIPQVSFIPNKASEYFHNQKLLHKRECPFIGRFENLNEDFSVLQKVLGMPYKPLIDNVGYTADVTRRKSDGKVHYSHFYDNKLRRLVEEIYSEDIERFGYSFEESGSRLPTNIVAPTVERCKRKHLDYCRSISENNPKVLPDEIVKYMTADKIHGQY